MANIFKKIWGSVEETAANLERTDEVKKWMIAVDEALKREKDWRKGAKRVVELYEQQEAEANERGGVDFNILYANTETLAPAVYNNLPRPVVKRKIKREGPLAIAAAQILKATLVYLTDTGDRDHTPFDDLQRLAVQEALVPGRGLARFYYEADMEGEGDASVVKSETICGDPVPWNRIVYGYAKVWADIPWLAYEHFMTREECKKNFGDAKGGKIKLTHTSSTDQDGDQKDARPTDSEGMKFAHVLEIWDKATRKVIFISDGYPDVLKSADDPLRLDGFFDAPRPISFLQRISSLQPRTLYTMYEKQAIELEKATRRINGLLDAMKIRGFYDGTLEGLDELLTKPENTLLPAKNALAMQQGQTLEKAIWFMPLEQLITVLQQLYVARQQTIAIIHQLTGIADIMRGSSQASETLGAQEIKQAWGTMRLKRLQKEVQRFTRDCYRLKAELAAKHFSIDTFKQMTGVDLPMLADKQQAQLALQAQQMQAQMQPSQPGQPPAQPDPQLLKTIQTPAWEEVLQFLRNDSIRNYVIDIETNSTIDIEATEDKAELAEMMNSMGQLLNGVFPMVKDGILPFPAAKSLMLSVISKFRLGDEVEETFRAMQEPKAKPDPAAQKVEAEMKRDQQKFQMDLQRIQMEQKNEQESLQIQAQENELKREKLQMDMEYQRAMHAQRMQELQMKAVMQATAPAKPQPAESQPAGE